LKVKAKEIPSIQEISAVTIACYMEYAIPSNNSLYIKKLKGYKVKRQLFEKLNQGLQELNQGKDISETLNNIQNGIGNIDFNAGVQIEEMPELAATFLENLEDRKMNKGTAGLMSGYADIDRQMPQGLFEKGDLTIIGGRPSMGKTTLVANLMRNISDMGHYSAFFSLEMSKQKILKRAFSGVSKINSIKLASPQRLSKEDENALVKANSRVSDFKWIIDDRSPLHYREIIASAKKYKRLYNIEILFIDYLGFIRSDKVQNRDVAIGIITRELKGLAKSLDVPVVLLMQLNRNLENREDKRPRLSDLRESGNAEQDADIVMFVYRQEKYSPEVEAAKGKMEIIFAKGRDCDVGAVTLKFEKETTNLYNLERNNY